MINSLTARVSVLYAFVGRVFVGVDSFRFRVGRLANELVQPIAARRFDNAQPNVAVAFNRSDNHSFVSFVSAAVAMDVTANIGFVNFDNPLQKIGADFSHRGADSVTETPSGLVRYLNGSLELAGG